MNVSRFTRFATFAALGLVLYLGFLVATLPAAWLAEGAARLSGGALLLVRPSGTLWSGAGELLAGHAAGGARPIGKVQWSLSPWWLFLGAAQIDLSVNGPSLEAEGTIRVARDYLRGWDLSAELPASLVSLVYGPVAFFEPKGTLALRAPSVELTAAGLVTDAELQWQGAGGRFTGEKSLGDYRLELNGAGETARLRLTTLRGDLGLAGQGQWRVTGDGTFRFTGSATPRGDTNALEPLLRALGPDRGDGRRDIRLNARLPLVELLGFQH